MKVVLIKLLFLFVIMDLNSSDLTTDKFFIDIQDSLLYQGNQLSIASAAANTISFPFILSAYILELSNNVFTDRGYIIPVVLHSISLPLSITIISLNSISLNSYKKNNILLRKISNTILYLNVALITLTATKLFCDIAVTITTPPIDKTFLGWGAFFVSTSSLASSFLSVSAIIYFIITNFIQNRLNKYHNVSLIFENETNYLNVGLSIKYDFSYKY